MTKRSIATLLFKEEDEFHISKFGLPHFQRGSVWDDRNIGLLLESLLYSTPIGILILWRPDEDNLPKYGTTFEWSSMDTITHLVIDGQQRLTALERVKQDLLNTKSEKFWALNFSALNSSLTKKYSDQLVNATLQRSALFVQVTELQKNKNDQRVARLVLNSNHTLSINIPDIIQNREQFTNEPGWLKLHKQVQQMFEQTWNIRIYNESPKGDYKCDLPSMVSLYNRLNIAGRPVSSEERAYASLVRSQPELVNDWFRDRFSHAHGTERDNTRKFMTRKREHQIGMTFFLRCLIQSLEFHFNIMKANRSLDNAHNEFLLGTLEDEGSIEKVKKLFSITAYAVDFLVDVLRTELACDDFRFIPSAKPLRLAFDFILRFTDEYVLSQSKEANIQCIIPKECVAEIILQLQLLALKSNNFDKKDKDLRKILNKRTTLKTAMRQFQEEDGLLSWTSNSFKNKLEKSQTVRNSWVSLLYWLQRSNQAMDPNPVILKQGEYIMLPNTDKNQPLAIEKNSRDGYEPHKEHIIPFSHLIRICKKLQQKDRNKEHLVNSIGNLTFISSRLNYRTPSNEPLLLQIDKSCLLAHHGMSVDWIKEYSDIVRVLQRSGDIYNLHKELDGCKPNTHAREQCQEKIDDEYKILRAKLNGKREHEVPFRVMQLFSKRIEILSVLFAEWVKRHSEKSSNALEKCIRLHKDFPSTEPLFPINLHEVKKVRQIVGTEFHKSSINHQKELVEACLSIRSHCDAMKNVWSTKNSSDSDIIKSFGNRTAQKKFYFRLRIKDLRLSIGTHIDDNIKRELSENLNCFLKGIGKEPNTTGEITLDKDFQQHPQKVLTLLKNFSKTLGSIQ